MRYKEDILGAVARRQTAEQKRKVKAIVRKKKQKKRPVSKLYSSTKRPPLDIAPVKPKPVFVTSQGETVTLTREDKDKNFLPLTIAGIGALAYFLLIKK